MQAQTEKRDCDRYDQEALISWSYFNTTNFFNAKLLNYGENGLFFESEFKLQPGVGIYIRLDKLLPKHSDDKLHEGFRTVTLGETRWCNEILATGLHKYAIGINYYQPY
jgi:hypothetical protein